MGTRFEKKEHRVYEKKYIIYIFTYMYICRFYIIFQISLEMYTPGIKIRISRNWFLLNIINTFN